MEISALLVNEIRSRMPLLELRENEPMSRHCSFRIGGPAAAMALPASGDEVRELCRLLREKGTEPLVIGNGTNLLVTDGPLDRVVIKLGEKMSGIKAAGEQGLLAMSGVTLARLAVAAQGKGLAGLEFAHGIPGSLGGAVCMNAGAYGGEMKDVVTETLYLDEELNMCSVSGEGHGFSYRHSMFSEPGKIVLCCEVQLTSGDPDEIRTRMHELMEKRRASQPLEKPSAGSTFKRPSEGYAAELIDRAGLKGFATGGAQVSEKHAGFVVNTGSASFSDVLRVMEHIGETVLREFGIELEPEVRIIR